MSAGFKTVPLALAGPMDTVSPPDQVAFGSVRYRRNLDVSEDGKLCRVEGWRRFLGSPGQPYNNEDLHDQLCADVTEDGVVISENLQTYFEPHDPPVAAADQKAEYPPNAPNFSDVCTNTESGDPLKRDSADEVVSQYITALFPAVSTSGTRKLLAFSQTRGYSLNQHRGNWKLFADGLGGAPTLTARGPRFKVAQVNDIVVFTNNRDPIQYYPFGGPTLGCAMQASFAIQDLLDLQITKAAAIYAWKGIVFLGNIEENFTRKENKIVWSDQDNPLSFDPSIAGTKAGFQVLDPGEKILGFTEIGDNLIVITTHGFHIVTIIPQTDTDGIITYEFNFQKRYAGDDRDSCVAFVNTVVRIKDSIFYLGQRDIYRWTINLPAPELVPWIHLSSGLIFKDIDRDACDIHVAGYDVVREKLFVSWAENGNDVPNRVMVFDLKTARAYEGDFPATCYCNYVSDSRGTLADFLIDICACTEAGLEDALAAVGLTPTVKEGRACSSRTGNCDDIAPDAPLWTRTAVTIDGVQVPDFSLPPDPDSIGAQICDMSLADLCEQCDTRSSFLMASVLDKCLKDFGDCYFHETYVGSGLTRSPIADYATTCGQVLSSYRYDGYKSYQIHGALHFSTETAAYSNDLRGVEKTINAATMSYTAAEQVSSPSLYLKVGTSSQPVDPLDPQCLILWEDTTPVRLNCMAGMTKDQAESTQTRPANVADFSPYSTGNFLYIEWGFEGTGLPACFSSLSTQIQLHK